VKAAGAKGDGTTDDTVAIQALFNSATASDIIYFDHGAYVVTSTVKVPKDIRITGEIWPLIMAGGTAFSDQTKPAPVFQVGPEEQKVGAAAITKNIFRGRSVCRWISPSVVMGGCFDALLSQVCSVWIGFPPYTSKSRTSCGQACRLINRHVIQGEEDRMADEAFYL
jgi:hypothetical protein